MKKYYKERFEAQQKLFRELAPLMEVNEILEKAREELRLIITNAMEVCILILDKDADKYTRPLQCALFERPVNCQACKRDRPAIQKAIQKRKAVIVSKSEPVKRMDKSVLMIGPEGAIPVFVEDKLLAVVSVVAQPGTVFDSRDLYLMKDFSELLGDILLNAKRQWEMTQEKLRISRMLANLSPFVPESVRNIVKKNPELLSQKKETKAVSILFLDLEGYSKLSASLPDTQVNEIIEKMFSSFIDPIHRSHGDINETAGDALMIIFKDHDTRTNVINSVKAAFEISERNRVINQSFKTDLDHPIDVNIGINSGNALVGMTRFKGSSGTRMTYTATGSVTNIASRLSDYAKGGDILIGEETKRMLEDFWPTYDRGMVALKGIEDPLRVYSLLKK
ncbi:MAG: GAF domain-containing protein [Deltaproteobacteria bacterium]|nr:GAF domain-containing protein [Deltaproteobacteria bacterium]MBW2563257.1 GAF domain-containing protein [Deltaproteobacteria bacterium]